MIPAISASVGARESAATNALDDVALVQNLLLTLSELDGRPELALRSIDGRIGKASTSETVGAIRIYQLSIGEVATGILRPGDLSVTTLMHDVDTAIRREAISPARLRPEAFPLERIPREDWQHPPRSFGADRPARRAHAGCDLYAPHGTWICALRAGTVMAEPSPFYKCTYALTIDHGDCVIRYGEIRPCSAVHAGQTVRAGQRIAMVGHLVGINVPSDMLHLEMYSKNAPGPLTVRDEDRCCLRSDGVPFYRRLDLIDPTPTLDRLAQRATEPA